MMTCSRAVMVQEESTDPLYGQLPFSMAGFTGRIELTEGYGTIFFDDCPACPMNSYFQEYGSFTFDKYSDVPQVIKIIKDCPA